MIWPGGESDADGPAGGPRFFAQGVKDDLERTVLYDPQTAGGLLLSVARDDAHHLLMSLKAAGVDAVEIGEVIPAEKPLIQVV